jgi:mTERF domain-containing protein
MSRQKPLTPKLEELIEELASNIKSYPETDKDTIMQTARALDSQAGYGQKQKSKDTLIGLLGYNTKGRRMGSLQAIPRNIMYLIDLGVNDVKKVVARHPDVLGYSIGKMNIGVNYLRSLGVKDENLGKIITRLPQVLEYSVENMDIRVQYLRSLGVKDEDIGKIVTKLPAVLEYSIEVMDTKVEFLKSIGIKDEDIGKFITKFPQVLGLDVEDNLKPTYKFLKNNFRVTVESIITSPMLLSYSLEKRIKPRYAFLKSKGLENKYKASTVLCYTDDDFASKLTKCPSIEYQTFKKRYLEKAA